MAFVVLINSSDLPCDLYLPLQKLETFGTHETSGTHGKFGTHGTHGAFWDTWDI